jgi:hypothetical protein
LRALAVALLVAVPLASTAGQEPSPLDVPFEEDTGTPSLALGPTGPGGILLAADVGWLTSGFQAHLGLTSWLELMARFEAMPLYQGLQSQNGVILGLRFAPEHGTFRYSASASVGREFIPHAGSTSWLTLVGGEGAVGLVLGRLTPYARGEIRGLQSDNLFARRWEWSGSVGAGLESNWLSRGQLILGGEAYAWVRPGSGSLFQWRLRVGWAL